MPPRGVMFHHFHGGGHAAGQGSIDAATLRRVIDHFGRDRILPAHEWLERAARGTLRESDAILTFDDTLLSQCDVAVPVLRELGLTACFFVCSSVLTGGLEANTLYRHFRATRFDSAEGFYRAFYEVVDSGPYCHRVRQALLRFDPRTYLGWASFYGEEDRRFRFVRDEVLGPDAYHAVMGRLMAESGVDPRALARGLWMSADHVRDLHRAGHAIGLHSHTHPSRLHRLSPQQQREEYTTNFRVVRQITGVAPAAAAHPYNSYSPYTLSILRQLGISVAFRSNATRAEGCQYELPREDHVDLLRALPAVAAADDRPNRAAA